VGGHDVQPIVLGPNLPDTFYRGDGRIGRFRGGAPTDRPEDWVGSVTARFGAAGEGQPGEGQPGEGRQGAGMTRLADGSLLADVIAGDPVGWLGREHVARHGADPALLVKLLDAGQRLPLHGHPDRGFAAEHLASPYGKTEAWIVLEADPGAAVYLGFSRDVEAAELAGWVGRQDVEAMLAVTNRVPVAAGDTVLCPAGTPHAIGAGILLVELQEPTDWSILLEWRGFPLEEGDATLGLPLDEALSCVGRRAYPPDRLRALRGRRLDHVTGSLLPAAADPFFVAERVRAGERLAPGYAVLVVTEGGGALVPEAGRPVPVRRGSTVLIPYAAGACALTGDFLGVRCRPAI
jgi:mannose-6-phosphate isomerase